MPVPKIVTVASWVEFSFCSGLNNGIGGRQPHKHIDRDWKNGVNFLRGSRSSVHRKWMNEGWQNKTKSMCNAACPVAQFFGSGPQPHCCPFRCSNLLSVLKLDTCRNPGGGRLVGQRPGQGSWRGRKYSYWWTDHPIWLSPKPRPYHKRSVLPSELNTVSRPSSDLIRPHALVFAFLCQFFNLAWASSPFILPSATFSYHFLLLHSRLHDPVLK